MSYKRPDIKAGKSYEKLFIHKINKIHDCTFKELHTFSPLDFFCEEKNIYCEVKKRNYKSIYVNPIMIGINKIKFGREKIKNGCTVHFYWRLQDNLFHYELKAKDDEGMFIGDGGRCDRGCDELRKVYYIPISLMDIVL